MSTYLIIFELVHLGVLHALRQVVLGLVHHLQDLLASADLLLLLQTCRIGVPYTASVRRLKGQIKVWVGHSVSVRFISEIESLLFVTKEKF